MTDLQDFLKKLKPNVIVRGPLFPEPVQVITIIPMGQGIKLIGTGTRTNQTYQPVLEASQLALLIFTPETEPFDGDGNKFKWGIEAGAWGWLTNMTPTSACLLPALIHSPTNKHFMVEEGVGRDSRYWALANALSALYPSGTDEKRWVEGVLERKKGLGF